MQALVVFESMFGNTRTVAEAIARGMAERIPTEVVEVGRAPGQVTEVDLLVVGAPTHAFGLSRSATRASAAEQAEGPLVSAGDGVREWLETVSVGPGTCAAAFDTHADKPVPGAAATVIRRRLRRLGLEVVARPESFLVTGVEGPLVVGEVERAGAWGTEIAAAALQRAAGRA